MQHDLELEFSGQPQHGENVVMTMRVMMDDALAVEHFQQRLHGEVAIGQLGEVAGSACDLVAVILRFDELFTHERCGFGARAGKRRRLDRIRPIGHLHSAGE